MVFMGRRMQTQNNIKRLTRISYSPFFVDFVDSKVRLVYEVFENGGPDNHSHIFRMAKVVNVYIIYQSLKDSLWT